MNKFTGEFYTLYKSFKFAAKGFNYAVDNERNMRIHLTAAVFVLQFALLYELNQYEYAVLFILFGVVICAEMINTAIEALVDLQTSSYATLGKIAKDVAAGSVLVLAVVSAIVAIILFGDIEKLLLLLGKFYENPHFILIAIAEIILGALFIFRWKKTKIFKN